MKRIYYIFIVCIMSAFMLSCGKKQDVNIPDKQEEKVQQEEKKEKEEKSISLQTDYHIEDYEKAAIVGLNGAGKTTLLRIIVGQLEPDGGVVAFAKDKTFGYLAQDSAVNSDNTIYEELLSVKQHLLDLENQIRQAELSMKQLSGDALEDLMQKYADLTHRFEMENGYAYKSELTGVLKGLGFTEDEFQKPVSTLSGGQKTRVALGKLLLQKPDLIILDEPTVGLDPAQVVEIRKLIRELGKAHTVILSSHILSEVQAVCSQVLILSKGHLVAVGAPEQLAEKLNPGSRLRATALGGGQTVLKAVGSIPGIRKVEIESEADGQVTFTAESADASDRRAEVSRALSQAGCTVLALAAENRTLEEVFLALTENESETPSDEGEEKTE